jgi:RNA 3'-terminal phosphate cyclase (ATP)
MLTIDGAEGGGQILRTAVALAALAQAPIRVVNIRAPRPKPGLQPQHLLAIRAVAERSGGALSGDKVGSMQIEFAPGQAERQARTEWTLDVGTAGSLTLLLQSLLPCLALGTRQPSRVLLRGGTNNPWAPPVEYMQRVLLPALAPLGVQAEMKLLKRGFYPRGGGEIELKVSPVDSLRPFRRTQRGSLLGITGLCYSWRLPTHVVQRMAQSATTRLSRAGYADVRIDRDTETPAQSEGCGIILLAEFQHGAVSKAEGRPELSRAGIILGADALGEPRKRAEAVGNEAAQALIEEIDSGAPVDMHLADQLVIWAALADGTSEYVASRRTEHLRSAVAVANQILGAGFRIEGDGPTHIICSGVGLKRRA